MLRSRDWEGIFRAAVNPSMEAAGKTLRYAVPAARKPGVAILATRATHASRPVFTPRKMPSQSRLLVICLSLHESFGLVHELPYPIRH
jgi:hypothetical protein